MSQLADCMKNAKTPEIQKVCIDTFSVGKDDKGGVATTQSPAQADAAHKTCSQASIEFDRAYREKAGVNGVGEFFGNVGARMKELGGAAVDSASGVRPERLKPFNRASFTEKELVELDALNAVKEEACRTTQRRR